MKSLADLLLLQVCRGSIGIRLYKAGFWFQAIWIRTDIWFARIIISQSEAYTVACATVEYIVAAAVIVIVVLVAAIIIKKRK